MPCTADALARTTLLVAASGAPTPRRAPPASDSRSPGGTRARASCSPERAAGRGPIYFDELRDVDEMGCPRSSRATCHVSPVQSLPGAALGACESTAEGVHIACCSKGTVAIPDVPLPPVETLDLYTRRDTVGGNFRDNVRLVSSSASMSRNTPTSTPATSPRKRSSHCKPDCLKYGIDRETKM